MEYFGLTSAAIMASPWIMPLLAWSLIWKGFALWRSANNKSKPWFVAILILNTFGILEILYLFVFGKKKN
jgi:methionyl-tRNA synthetase